jgi:hypothetical protein
LNNPAANWSSAACAAITAMNRTQSLILLAPARQYTASDPAARESIEKCRRSFREFASSTSPPSSPAPQPV